MIFFKSNPITKFKISFLKFLRANNCKDTHIYDFVIKYHAANYNSISLIRIQAILSELEKENYFNSAMYSIIFSSKNDINNPKVNEEHETYKRQNDTCVITDKGIEYLAKKRLEKVIGIIIPIVIGAAAIGTAIYFGLR